MTAEGGELLFMVVPGGPDQESAQGRMNVMRTVAWTAGRAVVVSGCLECRDMGRNNHFICFAKNGVEMCADTTCRCDAKFGHQFKASGLI